MTPAKLEVASLEEASRPPRWLPWATSEQEELRLINYCVNGAVLMLVAGAAVTQFLTVDRDIWRGWEFYEIVRRIPIDNWRLYQDLLAADPVQTKVGPTAMLPR